MVLPRPISSAKMQFRLKVKYIYLLLRSKKVQCSSCYSKGQFIKQSSNTPVQNNTQNWGTARDTHMFTGFGERISWCTKPQFSIMFSTDKTSEWNVPGGCPRKILGGYFFWDYICPNLKEFKLISFPVNRLTIMKLLEINKDSIQDTNTKHPSYPNTNRMEQSITAKLPLHFQNQNWGLESNEYAKYTTGCSSSATYSSSSVC